jgi:hypothetical protein
MVGKMNTEVHRTQVLPHIKEDLIITSVDSMWGCRFSLEE